MASVTSVAGCGNPREDDSPREIVGWAKGPFLFCLIYCLIHVFFWICFSFGSKQLPAQNKVEVWALFEGFGSLDKNKISALLFENHASILFLLAPAVLKNPETTI